MWLIRIFVFNLNGRHTVQLVGSRENQGGLQSIMTGPTPVHFNDTFQGTHVAP